MKADRLYELATRYGLEFWQVRLRTLLTYADVC
jgi:hypothetical protein